MEHTVKERSYKQMLWISMISMIMMFAGLTSAYVVSRNREDWLSFELPQAFFTSTILIILSSITYILANRAIKNNNRNLTSVFLISTFILGLAFVNFQFVGFSELIDSGLYLTGPGSNVSSSFLYVITITHVIHIMAGIIALFVVIIQHFRHKYTATDKLGLELGAIFWHFVDIVWIYLFLFFYFIR